MVFYIMSKFTGKNSNIYGLKKTFISTPQKRNVDLIPFGKIYPIASQDYYMEI